MPQRPDLETLETSLEGKNPRTILKAALNNFERIAISFSGAEDVVLIDLALAIRKDLDIFVLDTGRLHAETYQYLETVREHYNIALDVRFPDAESVQSLVRQKGLFSFYEDGHQECCGIRKVKPLRGRLSGVDAWITGQRKDQNPTRERLAEVQLDDTFSTPDHPIIKFNPLANWTSTQVWDHIEAYQVPFNPLHSRGFRSIGCEPCTRSTAPHQHEREGRWWWEDTSSKECGLHAGNLQQKPE